MLEIPGKIEAFMWEAFIWTGSTAKMGALDDNAHFEAALYQSCLHSCGKQKIYVSTISLQSSKHFCRDFNLLVHVVVAQS